MATTVNISDLNRPITIQKFVYGQDDSGGNIKALVTSYSLMADVQLISNYYALSQLQLKYGEAYRVKVRYEPSRLLTSNDEITYDGKILKIKGIVPESQAQKRFNIITASTGNTQSNMAALTTSKEFHYTAAGGETGFQNDLLKAWQGIILFFRDKFQFRVIKTGLPNTQQVLYDDAAGTFTFNAATVPMETDETADVYLI